MSRKIAILYNGDGRVAYGEVIDGIPTSGVLDEVEVVEAGCRENGWEPTRVAVDRDARRFLEELSRVNADLAFNLVEGVGIETRLEPAVAWLLEWIGIPFTGSPGRALLVAQEKPLMRAALEAAGVPVPRGLVLERGEEAIDELRYPLIVKPSCEDGSNGISFESVVSDESAARERARYVIEKYGQPALLEEFVPGREFNIALLGSTEIPEALPVWGIDFTGSPVQLLTYAAKWVPGSLEYEGWTHLDEQEIEPALAECIATVGRRAWRAIGMRDYGRIEVRLCPESGPKVIDVNPNPDLSPEEWLALPAESAGISHPELIGRIVESALARPPLQTQ